MFKATIGNDKVRLYTEDSVTPEFEGAGIFTNRGVTVKLNPLPTEQTESAGYTNIVRQGITKSASNFSEGGRYFEVALESAEDVSQMLEDSKTKGQIISRWAWVPETGKFYLQIGTKPADATDKQLASIDSRDAECRENIIEALLDASVFAPAS